MHFKLDENADPRWRLPLEKAGHGASTVIEEALAGSEDPIIAKVCLDNQFTLLTVDQGFAQILHYPPQRYPGIIVLRHPKPTLAGMRKLVEQVAEALIRVDTNASRLYQFLRSGKLQVKVLPSERFGLIMARPASSLLRMKPINDPRAKNSFWKAAISENSRLKTSTKELGESSNFNKESDILRTPAPPS